MTIGIRTLIYAVLCSVPTGYAPIFSNLIRPMVLVVNNVAAIALERLDVHTLYRVPWAVIAPVSAGVSMAMLMKKIIQSKPMTIPVRVTSPVSPPGSASIEHFTDTCTACHLCVSACPSRVLVPSFLEFGSLGIRKSLY